MYSYCFNQACYTDSHCLVVTELQLLQYASSRFTLHMRPLSAEATGCIAISLYTCTSGTRQQPI